MRVIILTLLLTNISFLAYAQDDQALDNYTPPPLFAEPKEVPVRPKAKVPTLPPISKKVDNPPEAEKKDEELLVKPRVIKQVNDKAPEPPAKPKPPIQPQGVVKGPKTMPAVKKQNVETEVTYEDEKNDDGEILERAQQPETKEIVTKTPALLDIGN